MPCSKSAEGGWYPNMPCRFPGPHPGGKLRGLARQVSRPTPNREVKGSGLGGCIKAHTWGFSRPTPRGVSRPTLGGGVSRPTPRGGGVSRHALRQTPPDSPLLWPVCILLEFIQFLTTTCFLKYSTCKAVFLVEHLLDETAILTLEFPR